jgi:DNA-directed RNA polymerase specialized sigma24 family protein
MVMITARDFRNTCSTSGQAAALEQCVREFLPLVNGAAAMLLPDIAESIDRVTKAAFRTFDRRARRLSKKTVLAAWLLRTTWFAARHERRRLTKAAPDYPPLPNEVNLLFRSLVRLRPALLDAVILRCVLQISLADASRALRKRERRVEKWSNRGLKKLSKALRKRDPQADPRTLLLSLAPPVPPETVEQVLAELAVPAPRRPKDELVTTALRRWRWFTWKGRVRRAFLAGASALAGLAMVGLTLFWLLQQGFLTLTLMKLVNHRLVHDVPELAQPARPWPAGPLEKALAAQPAPKTSADLYDLTNIWLAKLSFTRDQWRRIAPSHIPMANMHQPNGELRLRNPKAHRSGLAGVIGLDFNWTQARLDFASLSFPEVGVRYRGNGTFVNSLFGPKQSFKVDLHKFSKEPELAGEHTLNFVNSIPDNSYLHDALAERLFRDLGVPAPRTSYAYLTVALGPPDQATNQPLGLYVLIEDIDREFAKDRFGSKDVPIFKPVTPQLFKDLGSAWKDYADIYDLKTKATPAQRQRVVEFAQLVSHADDAEFARRLPEFLDLQEFAAFLAGHVLLSSYDGFLSNGQNFYMYLVPSSNRFGFISWDHDHAWGEFGYIATADQREHASIWQPSTYDNRFLNRVLKVDGFRLLYRKQLEKAMSSVFTVERLDAQIDDLASRIRPAVAAESDFRLHRFDLAISTNWVSGPRDGAPEGPKAPVHQMKRFIVNRVASVRAQLDGAAQGVVLQHSF